VEEPASVSGAIDAFLALVRNRSSAGVES